ncbi:hypothetical protein BIS07_12355 [Halomonas sp. FL8]|nr:hypothetical protein [Halomonas sp. FL8]MCP1343033.1 hypothetical protein [Halomonas sp. FL8]
MALTWQDFLEGVRNDPHGSPKSRLEILEAARDLFERKGSLKQMTQNERCAIAGTGSQQESKTYRGLHWSWFGTMRGLGTFASLINKAPDNISDALYHIPLSGDVDQEHYEHFVADFSRAFTGEPRAGNIATASRLLAMKRPDHFIALNRANQRGLAEGFGVGYTTIRLDTYWNKIVMPTRLSPWWNHPKPRSGMFNRRVWDARAAMMGCIYYVGN